ncbi:hypothetical protein AIGOOFII_2038 [Methylobacterium marchantiae]|nr:hypothetical protein AIGOOFII_2038 [Methylobacterium marchantiae]
MTGASLDSLSQGITGEDLALLPATGRPLTFRMSEVCWSVQKSRSA